MTAHEPVIGLEIHVQLDTATKLFCGDPSAFGEAPNTLVCPVCLGLPGALPVLNTRAVALAVRAALGLGCTVHRTSVFARKNYFYPDLPKGYQITQYDRPLATAGRVRLAAGDADGDADEAGAVRIRRVHLEEDAGKLLHDRFPELTAVDFNRAGVPLIEIVTEPDLRSPGAARAFLVELKRLLAWLEVSDCDMEKGSLRVDANVSVRAPGDAELGARTEVKNMNSFAAVEAALAFEVQRQAAVLEASGAVEPATLLWDADRGEARPMRSKETSRDYRYFPEPDLPPLVVEEHVVEAARAALPELPADRAARFRDAFGLPAYDADVLTATRPLADYFEAVAVASGAAKAASNWVMTEVLAWANRTGAPLERVPLPAAALAELIALVADGTLSSTMAREVFAEAIATGRSPGDIVVDGDLAQVGDMERLRAWARETVAEHGEAADRYRAGEEKVLSFLMGRLMRRSDGRADPARAMEVLRKELAGE